MNIFMKIHSFSPIPALCLAVAVVSACGTPPTDVEGSETAVLAGEAATAAAPGAGTRSGNLLLGIGIDLF